MTRPIERAYFEAADLIKKAVECEKNGNISMAIKYYTDAVGKARGVSGIINDPNKQANMDNLIDRSLARIEELQQYNIAQPPRNSSNPPIPSKKVGKEGNNMMESAIMKERPDVKFSDVAGLDSAKQALTEAVLLPIRIPGMFTGPTKPWKGILLFGPPGTGKSFLAKAVAGEANQSTFLTVSTADLTSKWLGESEKLIKSLFETARANRPSVVFIDEIDSLVSSRNESDSESGRRIKTEFLIQMDGVGVNNDGVLIIGATNFPWVLDPAIRRRFEKRVYIPLPDARARGKLIRSKLEGALHNLTKDDISLIAKSTEGFSGADISILVRDGLMQPIREFQESKYFVKERGIDQKGVERDGLWKPCKMSTKGARNCSWEDIDPKDVAKPVLEPSHIRKSISKIKPSVSKSDLIQYEKWTREYGEDGK